MTDQRFSFESSMTDTEAEDKKNSGLKLKPSQANLNQKQVKQDFQRQAANAHKRLEGHLKEAYELGIKFNDLMSDTRVPENIGPYDRSFEKEIIRKLITYAINVNADDDEQEGMGSVSLIMLMLKIMFKMRDKMNKMSYNSHKLEARILHLEKSILSSQAKASHETE